LPVKRGKAVAFGLAIPIKRLPAVVAPKAVRAALAFIKPAVPENAVPFP
jgi:hypothetical protein